MLYDRAKIEVQAGSGGNGCVSFRREAHVPKGGPDGGDGGKGGDVVLVCDGSLRDLHGLKRKPRWLAGRGGHGEGALRHGADGKEIIVTVPPGTEALGEDGELAERRYELLAAGQRVVLAQGGSGGRGNKRFATPTRQAPRFAENGLPGEHGIFQLRLKLLADIGLVGLPNAGKSSLLSRLTRAQPKVASYPFTTLEPVLGVLDDGERQLVIADIPGLIEGASTGAGLGHEFLAHVERCRLLVHVLDISVEQDLWGGEQDGRSEEQDGRGEGEDGRDEEQDGRGEGEASRHEGQASRHEGQAGGDGAIFESFRTIERELAAHHSRLAQLPRILVLAKADLLPAQQTQAIIQRCAAALPSHVPVLATSSATGAGLAQLSQLLLRSVSRDAGASGQAGAPLHAPTEPAAAHAKPELAQHIVYRPHASSGFTVERLGPGRFAVQGKGIERLARRFDVENVEAMSYLEARLRRIGVIAALEDEGFQPHDQVLIAGIELELDPEA